jgi:hypothetical protein
MIQSDNKLHNQFKLKSNITLMKFNNNWTLEVNSKLGVVIWIQIQQWNTKLGHNTNSKEWNTKLVHKHKIGQKKTKSKFEIQDQVHNQENIRITTWRTKGTFELRRRVNIISCPLHPCIIKITKSNQKLNN